MEGSSMYELIYKYHTSMHSWTLPYQAKIHVSIQSIQFTRLKQRRQKSGLCFPDVKTLNMRHQMPGSPLDFETLLLFKGLASRVEGALTSWSVKMYAPTEGWKIKHIFSFSFHYSFRFVDQSCNPLQMNTFYCFLCSRFILSEGK